MEKSLSRGDLYYADLSPVIGSEQGGIRPVLVISNNLGNAHGPTTIIAAVTSRSMKAPLPTHHFISAGAGLERSSIVLLEQIRTIDKLRLREHVGALGQADMRCIDRALAVSVGLEGKLE
jgi:mRNA interferase MazF